MNYYVYITTNLISKKQYIGDHSTNNLNDKYLGSGKILMKSIKKDGRQNFDNKILEQFETKQQAFDAQAKYIKQYNTLVPNGYNISPKGGHQCKDGMSKETKLKVRDSLKGKKRETFSEITKKRMANNKLGTKHSEETKTKIGLARKGQKHSEEAKTKISKSNKGKHNIHFSEEHNNKISEALKGKKCAEETKIKIGLAHKGKNHKPFSEESRKKMSIAQKGKKMPLVSNETKEKISKSLLGKKRKPFSKETKIKMRESHIGKKHNEETKKKISISHKLNAKLTN
jgi:hypothetical protein